MYLPAEVFQTVVASTPLVSIDLVVENAHGEILLGLRNNRPAQGRWFVPGGRVLKNETLDAAFIRLTSDELGVGLSRASSRFLGVYEHIYGDSVFGETPGTHYVVLAYHLHLNIDINALPAEQHNKYRCWEKGDALSHAKVHENSKVYLEELVKV